MISQTIGKSVINTLFSTTQNGTNSDNMVNNKVDSVNIYLRFLYYGDKGVLFIKYSLRTIKINLLKDRPIISVTLKTEPHYFVI